jgi:hypothetical protein
MKFFAEGSAAKLVRIVGFVAVALSATGCGPILSTYLIVDAEAKLAAAEAAEADKYALYEYTASSEYLHKAHEELGYADYGPAIDYAFKAADLAAQGTERAKDERSKHVDEPAAEITEASEPTPNAAAAPPPKKVIIKKLDTPSVPGSDPSTKPKN